LDFRELDTSFDECLVNLDEVRHGVLHTVFKSLGPLLDQVCDTALDVFVHLWVVQVRDQLLHEHLARDLLMELHVASIHHDIEQAESEEHNF